MAQAENTKTNEIKKKPWRVTKWHADHLRWATPVFMSSLGYLYPNPKLWFETLGLFFAFLAVVLIIVSTFWEFVSYYLATPPG
jgi:surface polysaccharide O-acyltransferase-like enzyme